MNKEFYQNEYRNFLDKHIDNGEFEHERFANIDFEEYVKLHKFYAEQDKWITLGKLYKRQPMTVGMFLEMFDILDEYLHRAMFEDTTIDDLAEEYHLEYDETDDYEYYYNKYLV